MTHSLSCLIYDVTAAYRAFLHYVTPAILVFQDNEMAAFLERQTNPVGLKLIYAVPINLHVK